MLDHRSNKMFVDLNFFLPTKLHSNNLANQLDNFYFLREKSRIHAIRVGVVGTLLNPMIGLIRLIESIAKGVFKLFENIIYGIVFNKDKYKKLLLKGFAHLITEPLKVLSQTLIIESVFLASPFVKIIKKSVLEMVSENKNYLSGESLYFLKDEEIFLAAINNCSLSCGCSLIRNIPDKLKNNEDIFLKFMKEDGSILKYAGDELKNNKDFILKAMKEDGSILKNAGDELKNDKDFILNAMELNRVALKYASDTLKKDQELVLKTTRKHCLGLLIGSPDLLKDQDFLIKAMELDRLTLKIAEKITGIDLEKDQNFLLKAIKQNDYAFMFAGDDLKKDQNFFLKSIEQNGLVLKYASDELKKNNEVVSKAVEQNGLALQYASDDLKKNQDIVVAAYKNNKESFGFAIDQITHPVFVLVEKIPLRSIIIEQIHSKKDQLSPEDFKKLPLHLQQECGFAPESFD